MRHEYIPVKIQEGQTNAKKKIKCKQESADVAVKHLNRKRKTMKKMIIGGWNKDGEQTMAVRETEV